MIKDMCEFRIDRLTVQLSINVKPHVVKQIDNTRGNRSRSGFINDCIIEHFTPKGQLLGLKPRACISFEFFRDTIG
jgi:hypothetical protein